MRSILLLFVPAFFAIQPCAAQIPFILTETAAPLGKGKIDAGLGMEYLEKNRQPAPENPRSLFRIFVATLRHGVAENVNYDLTWRGGLFANLANGRRDFDWGDLSVWTKIALVREGISMPALALQSGVKLPNTRYSPSRLGSNQMDFHTRALASKRWSYFEIRGNFGFSILGDPTSTGSQDDVYTLSFAGLQSVSENGRMFAEILAQTGYQDHDDKVVTRFGVMIDAKFLTWTVYGTARIAGNNKDFSTAFEHSENWSIGVFIQKSFHAPLWSSQDEQEP